MVIQSHFDLTEEQNEMLEFIIHFFTEYSCSPTVTEIGKHFSLSNWDVNERLAPLIRKKYLRRCKGKNYLARIFN